MYAQKVFFNKLNLCPEMVQNGRRHFERWSNNLKKTRLSNSRVLKFVFLVNAGISINLMNWDKYRLQCISHLKAIYQSFPEVKHTQVCTENLHLHTRNHQNRQNSTATTTLKLNTRWFNSPLIGFKNNKNKNLKSFFLRFPEGLMYFGPHIRIPRQQLCI